MFTSLNTARLTPRSIAMLAAALALSLLSLWSPSPSSAAPSSAAAPTSGLETQIIEAVNEERAAVGLAELQPTSDLQRVARDHSRRMATASDLHHNPALGDDVTGWRKVGENVGRSRSVEAVHTAFMDSPTHEANVLDAEWSEMGIGVEVRDGTLWVTQVFRAPDSPALLPF